MVKQNKKQTKKPTIVVVLGPTASGKSDLAVTLSKHLNGEVVSADSRQVYKGLDIGSGKITKKEMKGVPHHLLNVIDPKKVFTIEDFRIQATKAIDDILARGKMPILCGGTGFYIQSIVDGITVPNVPADKKLREKLEKLSVEALLTKLKKLNPTRAKTVDTKNKVRLIRAIEIAGALGKVPKLKSNPKYDCLQIGIRFSDEKTKARIALRLEKRIKAGMIQEAEKLHQKGLSWKRMEALGLEYRYLALYLQKKISKQEMIDQLNTAIRQYAKRQMVWFKRDERIIWVEIK